MNDASQLQYDLVLARLGEIALKGLNRNRFEKQLFRNMRARLSALGDFTVQQNDSRIWVESTTGETNTKAVLEAIRDVFGLVSASPVIRCDATMDKIEEAVLSWGGAIFSGADRPISFKINIKRINRSFPVHSYELACAMGDLLLTAYPDLARVDVHNPDKALTIEIRDQAYLYHEFVPCRKGLPVGMGGKGMLLLSGGIDSPVAGYLMASRGMQLEACYFHTFPYTSEEAKQKVIDLAQILTRYCGTIPLHIVDFTELELEIKKKSPPDMGTIVMRRMMVRIAEEIARQRGIKCLITGESLGQVASQTLEALVTTDAVATMPVFRPLIGTDKDDTVRIARDIGTFETSILPYEDCCTVFVAKHPKTHPSLEEAQKAEADLDAEYFSQTGAQRVELHILKRKSSC